MFITYFIVDKIHEQEQFQNVGRTQILFHFRFFVFKNLYPTHRVSDPQSGDCDKLLTLCGFLLMKLFKTRHRFMFIFNFFSCYNVLLQ